MVSDSWKIVPPRKHLLSVAAEGGSVLRLARLLEERRDPRPPPGHPDCENRGSHNPGDRVDIVTCHVAAT